MGDVAISLIKIHQKCLELLSNSQGVSSALTKTHPGDLLETVLCTDALLFCLEVPEDKVVDSALAQNLLGIVLTHSDHVVVKFIAHILHLHLNYPGAQMIYRAESRLGLKVLEKLKTMSIESLEYYMQVFEQVYAK